MSLRFFPPETMRGFLISLLHTRSTRAIKYYDQSRLQVDETKTKEFLATTFDTGNPKISMVKRQSQFQKTQPYLS